MIYNKGMEPTPELAAKLDQDRRDAWERMSFAERLLAGPVLFDMAVAMMKTGVRLQFPDANEEQVERLVTERLRKARRFEDTE